jgi:hypothetical protein
MRRIDLRSIALGSGVAALSFGLLGTVSALTIRRRACSAKLAGSGGVLGFLGIACPVCNKVLLLLFGGELLLTYYEPIRIYVAALGVAVAALAVGREWWLQKGQLTLRTSAP